MQLTKQKRTPRLRGRLLHHLRLLAAEPDYDDEEWSGAVSFLAGGETSPVSVDIPDMQIESEELYDPRANGEWRLWFNEPSPVEQVEPRDIADVQDLNNRPLVFWHFKSVEQSARAGQDFDQEVLRLRLSLHATVAALLSSRQEPEASPAVKLFLQHYRDIPQKKAWFVQPLFLGANLPFKYWPCCIWIGRASPNGRGRLFSQPLTHEGVPLGRAWSWPINDWVRDRFELAIEDFPSARLSKPTGIEEGDRC